MNTFLGIPVQVSSLAIKRTRRAVIERCSMPPKRRRQWTLRYVSVDEPAVYQLWNGTLVVHPNIYRQMLKKNEGVFKP